MCDDDCIERQIRGCMCWLAIMAPCISIPICLCYLCSNDGDEKKKGPTNDTVNLGYGRYQGTMKRIKGERFPHGLGTLTYNDGKQYQGEFKDGALHGEGALQYPDGSRHEGFFVNGMMDGEVVFINKTGAGFKASWCKGVLVMKPVMKVVYIDNSVYEGGIDERGVRNGKGTFTSLSDNSVYVGSWENDMKHGHGKITMQSGNTYEGEWVRDKKHGQGLFVFGEGGSYKGGFENNLKHGKGTFITKEGEVKEGVWHKGKRVKPSKRNPETTGSFTTPQAASELTDIYDQSEHGTSQFAEGGGTSTTFTVGNPMLIDKVPQPEVMTR